MNRLNAYRADQIEDARITTKNLLLDWNEDTPESKPLTQNASENLSAEEINEDEVGQENFERYARMSQEDQKIARTMYRQRLTGESFSTSAMSANVMPDGMQNVRYPSVRKKKTRFVEMVMRFFGVMIISLIFAYFTLDTRERYD